MKTTQKGKINSRESTQGEGYHPDEHVTGLLLAKRKWHVTEKADGYIWLRNDTGT
jgi:hypothetical protein